jgi:hypothetical protein
MPYLEVRGRFLHNEVPAWNEKGTKSALKSSTGVLCFFKVPFWKDSLLCLETNIVKTPFTIEKGVFTTFWHLRFRLCKMEA